MLKRFLRMICVALSFLTLGQAVAAQNEVSVFSASEGYYTSIARHLVRWLKMETIETTCETNADLGARLAGCKLAFLVGYNEPTEKQMKALERFVAQGGKLVVFYSASPRLSALMDVHVVGYRAAKYPGEWSRMNFTGQGPEGLPSTIRQTSTVLQRARPRSKQGCVLATWVDRKGQGTQEPAWIMTKNGFWMTHILTADGDEDLKAQLVGALTGAVLPRLWNAAAHRQRLEARHQSTRAVALKQVPRKGELHAVWDHSGCGLYPGDWKRTMMLLREARITDLFINVAGAGFAHYPSKVLPPSRTYEQEGDQLAACLAAARGTGIRVHAWLLCFNTTRSRGGLNRYIKPAWRLKARTGEVTEYLNPASEDVQAYLLRAIDELVARYPALSGVHLDFVRWYERAEKPPNAPEVLSDFVADVRRHVRRPRWLTTAVLGKYPACIGSVGQDWESWVRTNLVDYVVPMNYSNNVKQYTSFIQQQGSRKSLAHRVISGIGVTANESRLSALEVIQQINIARQYNLAGIALFDLDVTLEKNILSYLKLGIW